MVCAKEWTMKFPANLSSNILKAFAIDPVDQCPVAVGKHKQDPIRICFEDSSVKTLQEICLLNLARDWERNPRLISLGTAENNNYFLKELNISGQELLTVTEFIKEDLFWKRQYEKEYGPRFFATPNNMWLQVFMEKHLQEWLEKLKPSEYEEEVVLERLEFYSPYVKTLTVHNFQPPPKGEIHHIPFNVILQSLSELRSIDISVNVKDAGEDFSNGCANLSDKDINALATGLELCDITEFRLGGTKLSPSMAKRLGGALEKCVNLKLLHLIDCSLSDQGVIAFLMGLTSYSLLGLEDLNLSNNFISSTGAFQLAIVLSKRSLKHLNLRLNPIKADGACLLFGKLFNLQRIESINFSACSLDSSIGVMLCKLIRECRSLIKLNLAVSSFGDQFGWIILEELKNNLSLLEFDIRNSGLSSTTTMLIDEFVNRNLIRSLEIEESLEN